jgi:hypothetical protein
MGLWEIGSCVGVAAIEISLDIIIGFRIIKLLAI